MNEVYEFLKECGTYFIATTEGSHPRVRPFGTIALFEGKLYIQTGRSKDVSKQIALNPNIEISATKEGGWIRLSAQAIDDNRVAAKEAMLDAYPNLKAMYSAQDDNTQVLYLQNVSATINAFGAEPQVFTF